VHDHILFKYPQRKRPALLKLPARQKTSMPNIVDYQ
jgi:hypothetical protein